MSTGFARDYAMQRADRRDARRASCSRVAVDVIADHGAFNADRAADALPGRVLQRLHRLLRRRRRALPRHRRRTRTRRPAGSRTRARSGSPRRSTSSSAASTAWRASWASTRSTLRLREPAAARPVPVREQDRLGLRLRRLRARAAQGARARRLRRAAARAGGEARARRADGDRRLVLHRGGRRRPAQAHGHARAGDERRRVAAHLARPAPRSSRSACRPRARATRRRSRRSSPHELGIPPDDVEVVHGDTDTTPYGLGTYGSRSTPVSGAATALAARKVRERARIVAAAMLEVAPEDLEWARRPLGGRAATRSRARRSARSRAPRAGRSSCPTGVEAGLDAEAVYDPPNLTFPFGAYVCVVDVDPGTAAREGPAVRRGRRLRRADQPDDRRGPDPRRADRRRRDGADGDDRVRRATATASAGR